MVCQLNVNNVLITAYFKNDAVPIQMQDGGKKAHDNASYIREPSEMPMMDSVFRSSQQSALICDLQLCSGLHRHDVQWSSEAMYERG